MENEKTLWEGSPTQAINIGWFALSLVLCLTVILAVVGIPLGVSRYLKVRCTKYQITNQRLKIASGVFFRSEEEIELYRMKDSKYTQSLLQRFFKVGNIQVISSDPLTPAVLLESITTAATVREVLRVAVERRRDLKRVREFDTY